MKFAFFCNVVNRQSVELVSLWSEVTSLQLASREHATVLAEVILNQCEVVALPNDFAHIFPELCASQGSASISPEPQMALPEKWNGLDGNLKSF